MSLNDKTIQSAKCPEDKKAIKLFDGNGLYLLVNNSGSKLWRMRFKFAKKHQELALGKYPTISLKKARELLSDNRMLLSQGINPCAQRRQRKSAEFVVQERKFQTIALQWWDRQSDRWTEEYARKVNKWISKECSALWDKAINDISVRDIATLMTSLKLAGTPKKAAPILSMLNRIFGFALGNEFTDTNPAQNFPLRDVIGNVPKVKHMPAITEPRALLNLISDINNDETGEYCSNQALKLMPHLFLRPMEIRNLKWEYVNFDEEFILYPAEEMKKSRDHIVPMSTQVIKKLKEIRTHTGYSEYVFPNKRDTSRCLSKNVLTDRLRVLGYPADIVSAHGFRSTASTILNENEWDDKYIEIQLAHLIGTSSSRPYNRAKYLKQRRKMMQWWSDYLDSLIAVQK